MVESNALPEASSAPLDRRTLNVVAALIFFKDTVLVQQRPPGSRHALLWEFPGGKVDPGETESEALVRECREELAVEIVVGSLVERIHHAYPDFDVELSLYRAKIVSGEPQSLQAVEVRFVPLQELTALPFTEADLPFVRLLAMQAS